MSVSGVEFDDGKSVDIDITTDPLYTFIRKSLNPIATDTEKTWLCKRITNASGVSSFANGEVDFSRPEKQMDLASTLTATYTR
jgi:hypothetical protein